MHVILFRKTGYLLVFVLPNPLNQVTGNADVKGSILFARQDVNTGLFNDLTL